MADSPHFDISRFYELSPLNYSLNDNSLEYLYHTTTESYSSSVFGEDLPSEDPIELEVEAFPSSLVTTGTNQSTGQVELDTDTPPPPEEEDVYIEDDILGLEPEPEPAPINILLQ